MQLSSELAYKTSKITLYKTKIQLTSILVCTFHTIYVIRQMSHRAMT